MMVNSNGGKLTGKLHNYAVQRHLWSESCMHLTRAFEIKRNGCLCYVFLREKQKTEKQYKGGKLSGK